MKLLKNMKTLLLCLVCVLVQQPAKSQPYRALTIGDTIPNLALRNQQNFPHGIQHIHDLKGKFVLLDFWSTWCSSCIHAFPKMVDLQQKFGDRFQVVLINGYEDYETIEKRMASMKSATYKELPDLPSVAGDSTWRALFPSRSVPHHVWLDPNGVVIGITGGYNANNHTIQRLLNGEKVDMLLKPKLDRVDLKTHTFADILGLGTTHFPVVRSSSFYPLYQGDGGTVHGYRMADIEHDSDGTIRNTYINTEFSILMRDFFKVLYPDSAFSDYLSPDRIQILVKDSSFLRSQEREQFDAWAKRFKICYETLFPMGTAREERYATMFEEVNKFVQTHYGWTYTVEDVRKKCFVLKVSQDGFNPNPATKHIAVPEKGGWLNGKYYSDYTGRSWNMVVRSLQRRFFSIEHPLTFISEVNFDGEVNMAFISIESLDDVTVLRKDLSEYGLELVEEERVIKMLVMRDYQ